MNRRSFIKTGLIYIPTAATVPVCLADRRRAQLQQKAAVSGGGCTSTEQLTNGGAFDDWNAYDTYLYKAAQFATGGSGFTCCKIEVYMFKTGTPAGNLTAKIYSESGGTPNVLVGSGSDAVAKTALVGGGGYVAFENLSAVLSSSTNYFVVVQASEVDGGSGNSWWIAQTSGAGNPRDSVDGSSWDDTGSNQRGFKLYS